MLHADGAPLGIERGAGAAQLGAVLSQHRLFGQSAQFVVAIGHIGRAAPGAACTARLQQPPKACDVGVLVASGLAQGIGDHGLACGGVVQRNFLCTIGPFRQDGFASAVIRIGADALADGHTVAAAALHADASEQRWKVWIFVVVEASDAGAAGADVGVGVGALARVKPGGDADPVQVGHGEGLARLAACGQLVAITIAEAAHRAVYGLHAAKGLAAIRVGPDCCGIQVM